MPPGKTRRKDDTWTTEDLTEALKGPRDDLDKKKRSRDDDDRKERRRHKDEVNGDDSRRRHRDDDKKSHKRDEEGHRGKGRSRGDLSPEPHVELTEEERERLRQERREKRGGDSKRKEDRPRKEEKPVDSDDDARRRSKREDSARRHRRRDEEEDGERRRRHGDDDGDRKRHRDKESRHRDRNDDDHKLDDEDGRADREHKSKRDRGDNDDRKERHRDREERHRDKEDRHKDRDRGEKHRDRGEERDRDREERHKDRDRSEKHRDRGERDREERHKDRDQGEKHRDRGDERDREERRRDRDRGEKHRDGGEERDREKERRREREKEEQRRREEEERKKKEEEEKAAGDDYNDYDDDFEDYEDDFEDDDELNEGGLPRRKPTEGTWKNGASSHSFMKMLALGTTEGEMEEVLRALDEENARLTSLSHRSNWSDSTELSDERFKEGEEPPVQGQQRGDKLARPRTFINFVSAKQRVMDQSVASKARRRANDLRNMIELDTVYYDLFDLPPVREYDLYIRSFGRSNTKQAYVQTNEDAVERDVQTEVVEDLDKWTQHPAEDLLGVGGEGITVKTGVEDKTVANKPETLARVGKFLERAAQVMNVILEEERAGEEGGSQARERTSNISISEGFSQLGCPSYLSGRHVERVAFCPMQPNMFLTLHSKPLEPSSQSALDCYGLILVWSVKETGSPLKILTCLSEPTCACFSPSRASLVIAGMNDGTVMVWDLREPSSLHRSVFVDGQELTTRFPTYNTAGVLEKENHHSPVTAITAVHPTVVRKASDDGSTTESEGSLSFQLASVEDNATVNLWVVTEIPSPDMAGSEVDLGLAPGGRVKLLRSSAIVLDNPNKLVSTGTFRALDIQLNPSDLNHFFVATDVGQVIHGVRFGSRVFPRAYQPEIESPRKITCLDFSPFGEPYFLAGCQDGSVHLYHTSLKHPLSSWPMFCEGHSILAIQWSRSRPAVFFVLAENSTLYTFDLVETGLAPVRADQISSGRATFMAVGSDPALIGGNKALPAHVLVALDNGSGELHTISTALRRQQPLETEFLTHYLERF